jgi:nucleoside-diphosphate-sugar epimerase
LSYIHVNQLVDLLVRAARSGSRLPDPAADTAEARQGCYYASLDEFPSYAEFGRMIARALGRKQAFVFPIAMPIPFIAAGVNELIARWRGKADPFNIDKIREANVGSWACSSSLAQRELGFRPSGTLAEHLHAIVEWYREHGWLRARQPRRSPSWSRLSKTQVAR